MITSKRTSLPIAVFDSGVGGISVLAELIKLLPNEKYIYMADSANAPYGTKSCETVLDLSVNASRTLFAGGIKALVVACNTATSVAINRIREELNVPVIGMEPALKPAVEAGKPGQIVVMATPLTLKEEKFNNLYSRYCPETSITPLPCPGLVDLIEAEAPPAILIDYLTKLFDQFDCRQVASVVLGCTHYCFVRNEILQVVGNDIQIFEGNIGTAKHLQRVLQLQGQENTETKIQELLEVNFTTTGDELKIIPLCKRFLNKAL